MQHSDFIPASRPALADPVSCEKWLEKGRVADPGQACAAFLGLLDQLEDAPPQADAFIDILETLRAPVQAALEEVARRFAGRALPLAPTEQAAFVQSCDLWLAQLRAWRRLLRAASKNPALAPERARLVLRTLECTAGLLTTHLAARHEIATEHWRWLHQAYALAEREGLAEIAVGALDSERTLTCHAAYARVLLLHLANPAALAQREFGWAQRWARRWAGKLRLSPTVPDQGGLGVDLDAGSPPRWIAASDTKAHTRRLDCGPIARSIHGRIKKLTAGETPESLGLGRDCTPLAAKELLATLSRSWSDAPQIRQFPRRSCTGKVQLVARFPEIHQALAGTSLETTNTPWDYSQRSMEQIHRFQRTSPQSATPAETLATETWETLDESANGFRLRRNGPGTRLAHRQLVALRPGGAEQFILCEIRWLQLGEDKVLHVGAKALPGLPQACAVRPRAANALTGPGWVHAFALPLSRGLAPNLVLPVGWYQQGRELDLKLGEDQFHICLEELVDRGNDYQRVRFSAVSAG